MKNQPEIREQNEGVGARARANPLRAACRSALFVLATVGECMALALQRLFVKDESRRADFALRRTHQWCRLCVKALGIKVKVSGALPPRGALIAPNHQGYVDIAVLGSATPSFFLPKIEISGWPLLGQSVRWSKQILVSREDKRTLIAASEQIVERLKAQRSVCVFLEGTSTGGGEALPFGPSLVQPAIDAGAPVVPACISYRAGSPLIEIAEDVAYWKDHVFGAHIWRLMGLKGVRARVIFGAPIATHGRSRKEVAREAWEAVRKMQC